MIVSSVLGAAALMALQGDPTRAPREAYTRCLSAFVEKGVDDKMTLEAFTAALTQQCTEQENAFRSAVRTYQGRMKVPADEIDEIIKEEVDSARDNMKQRFEMHLTPA